MALEMQLDVESAKSLLGKYALKKFFIWITSLGYYTTELHPFQVRERFLSTST